MDLSIIIVNYNTADHLKKCIDSILKYTNNISFEIIIIDNNSTNRDIEFLAAKYKNISFYFRDVNDGFGAGCNYGAKISKGKYLAFVNPDIIIESNLFQQFYKYLEENSNAGFVSGAFTNMTGQLTYSYNNFPNTKWELIQALGVGENIIINKLNKTLIKHQNLNISLEVDWIYGACMFISKNIFERIKGFDKSFFLYSEDIDLQYRIKKEGLKIICLPYVKIKHFTNSSVRSIEGRELSNFHFHRSKIIYMYKYFNLINRYFIHLINIIGFTLRLLLIPFRKKFRKEKLNKARQYKKIIYLYLSNIDKILNYTDN